MENAIGTQLRNLMKMAVSDSVVVVSERKKWSSVVITRFSRGLESEWGDTRGHWTADSVSRDQSLSTSRTGNDIRLIYSLLKVTTSVRNYCGYIARQSPLPVAVA